MDLLVTEARLITVPAGSHDPGDHERGWMLVRDGMITDSRLALRVAICVLASSSDLLAPLIPYL